MINYFWLLLIVPSLGYRIVTTSISRFFPSIRQHHIVLHQPAENITHAIDFTPIDQGKIGIQLRLIFGGNVPAEIRVKLLEHVDIVNDSEDVLLRKWTLARRVDLRDTEYHELYSNWTTMQLYTHNCQHFSAMFVGEICE